MEQKPSIGRIVHFVNGSGEHNAAIVVDVYDGGVVHLNVFRRFGGSGFVTCVIYSSEMKPCTWHWPERI